MAIKIGGKAHDDHDDVVRITSASESPSVDFDRRKRRYIWSMSFRTLCFIVAVSVGPGWLRWTLIGASLILPYLAVVMANAVTPPEEGTALPGEGVFGREIK